jgi:hypothetical protein
MVMMYVLALADSQEVQAAEFWALDSDKKVGNW